MDGVTGRARYPLLADKELTPFTEAFLAETQRKGNLLPLGVMHQAMEDVQFGGYYIPKGTQIFPNLGRVLNDPKFFPNPEEFNPERFLINDGKKFELTHHLIPFGIGKRRCLGETLARAELYIFFTGLMHRFKIEANPDEPLPSMIPHISVLSSPKPFKVKFVPRN